MLLTQRCNSVIQVMCSRPDHHNLCQQSGIYKLFSMPIQMFVGCRYHSSTDNHNLCQWTRRQVLFQLVLQSRECWQIPVHRCPAATSAYAVASLSHAQRPLSLCLGETLLLCTLCWEVFACSAAVMATCHALCRFAWLRPFYWACLATATLHVLL